ncbi:hypothetical protein HZ326_25737 [Fusarium oxysporum f. sp. albedinis]|nr:hypothetical protein HZ326_25737 [Fusarium oxysporum f. sp. albedinis]
MNKRTVVREARRERLAREKDQNPNVDKPNEGLLTGDCQGIGRIRWKRMKEEKSTDRGRRKMNERIGWQDGEMGMGMDGDDALWQGQSSQGPPRQASTYNQRSVVVPDSCQVPSHFTPSQFFFFFFPLERRSQANRSEMGGFEMGKWVGGWGWMGPHSSFSSACTP